MENLKLIAKTILAGIFILFLGYTYVRVFMLKAIWVSPQDKAKAYKVSNNERLLRYVFMPDQKMISIYSVGNDVCYQLGEIRGTYGNRVFGRLWYVELPEKWLNYYIIEDGYNPVTFGYDAEINRGLSCEAFPKIGSKTYFIAQFSRNDMKV